MPEDLTPVGWKPADKPQGADDASWMRLALGLARRGEGWVEPNPMVGCVLVRDGQLIGQGYHRRFGGPHAEIEALRVCDDPQGATAFVTLEPCSHHGKTPPCTAGLISVGVSRVVAAMEDPFPQVAGAGLAELRAAGIETAVGICRDEAIELNAPYLKRVRTGCPWVIAKWAMTLDGRIATVAGESQWITGEASRREVHQLRSRVDAIAVGMGTVEADDPLLTARGRGIAGEAPSIRRIAARVVFCRHRTPAIDSRLVQSVDSAPLVVVAAPTVADEPLRSLQRVGVTILRTESDHPAAMVTAVLRRSASDVGFAVQEASRGLSPDAKGQSLPGRLATNWMLEGGSELLASFFAAGQVDECQVHIGPLVFGGECAKGPVAGAGIGRLDDASRYSIRQVDRFGEDVRLTYRREKFAETLGLA